MWMHCLSAYHVGPAGLGGEGSRSWRNLPDHFNGSAGFLRFSSRKTGATGMVFGREFSWAMHDRRIAAWRIWRNLPAHFNAGFLAFSSENPVASEAIRSQLPSSQSCWAKIMTQSATLAPSFPDIGDSTLSAESQRGEEKASLTRCCCCFHLSPPAPQFPLTLHQHHQCNTIVQIPLLPLISVSCDVIPQRWGEVKAYCRGLADITLTKFNWSIRAYLLHSSWLMQQYLSSV